MDVPIRKFPSGEKKALVPLTLVHINLGEIIGNKRIIIFCFYLLALMTMYIGLPSSLLIFGLEIFFYFVSKKGKEKKAQEN